MSQVYQYFTGYIDEEDLAFVGYAEISSIAISRKMRSMELGIVCDSVLDYRVIESAQNSLKEKLMLKKATLRPHYNKGLFELVYTTPLSTDFLMALRRSLRTIP